MLSTYGMDDHNPKKSQVTSWMPGVLRFLRRSTGGDGGRERTAGTHFLAPELVVSVYRGTPIAGWLTREIPFKMDDLGVPAFMEPPIGATPSCCNLTMFKINPTM